jgi:hypothetical protein
MDKEGKHSKKEKRRKIAHKKLVNVEAQLIAMVTITGLHDNRAD